ncbi:MAG: protein kinase, partial [Planctomycetota bacterium]
MPEPGANLPAPRKPRRRADARRIGTEEILSSLVSPPDDVPAADSGGSNGSGTRVITIATGDPPVDDNRTTAVGERPPVAPVAPVAVVDDELGLVFARGEHRFELGAEIGSGGAGTVYRAFDPLLERGVAVKYLRGDDPTARARFVEEAQITAQLTHPNIVPVHTIGTDDAGAPFMTM